MTETKYEPPLDKLLTLGDYYLEVAVDWVDYSALGIGPQHIPDLLRMIDDGLLGPPTKFTTLGIQPC